MLFLVDTDVEHVTCDECESGGKENFRFRVDLGGGRRVRKVEKKNHLRELYNKSFSFEGKERRRKRGKIIK